MRFKLARVIALCGLLIVSNFLAFILGSVYYKQNISTQQNNTACIPKTEDLNQNIKNRCIVTFESSQSLDSIQINNYKYTLSWKDIYEVTQNSGSAPSYIGTNKIVLAKEYTDGKSEIIKEYNETYKSSFPGYEPKLTYSSGYDKLILSSGNHSNGSRAQFAIDTTTGDEFVLLNLTPNEVSTNTKINCHPLTYFTEQTQDNIFVSCENTELKESLYKFNISQNKASFVYTLSDDETTNCTNSYSTSLDLKVMQNNLVLSVCNKIPSSEFYSENTPKVVKTFSIPIIEK